MAGIGTVGSNANQEANLFNQLGPLGTLGLRPKCRAEEEFCGASGRNSSCCKNCCAIPLYDRRWTSTRRQLRQPSARLKGLCCRWYFLPRKICPRRSRHPRRPKREERQRREGNSTKSRQEGTKTCPFAPPRRFIEIDASSLVSDPTHRKEWRGRRDSNSRSLP